MHDTTLAPQTRREQRRADSGASRRQWSLLQVVVAVVLLAGIATIMYPTVAEWFSDRVHATEVSGYVDQTRDTAASELARQLDAATHYNRGLPNGPLRDPYVLNADGEAENLREHWDHYLQQLSLQRGAPMARIRIPEIDVDLPVYHGTDEQTLARGVGHLYGSSLPVGGAGTHSVLTGHSGLPSARLFTDLQQLRLGDEFVVEVMGETLYYRVDQIKTVKPDSGDELRRVAGRDYLTLLTCTPIGVNTHRLLVRGERIDAAEASESVRDLTANSADPGFPWWALILGGAVIGAAWIAKPAAGRVYS